MAETYIPTRESELAAYSANFSTQINIDPAAIGLSLTQASDFAALNTTWLDAYAVTQNGTTRSPANIATKNVAKYAMIANLRSLAAIIQAHPGITEAQLIDLGLTVRDTEPSDIPAPSSKPGLVILNTDGRMLKVRAFDPAAPNKRGRPENTLGLMVFTHVGPTAPEELEDWFCQGNFNTTTFEVEVAEGTPGGSLVWVTASWIGTRLESGPGATPISAHIPGGLSEAA